MVKTVRPPPPKKKQAQESLAAAMSLSDINGIVTSWADCYKNSTPNFNFSNFIFYLLFFN